MLNQLKLARAVRHTYAEAIERYLDYCRLNGVSVRVESARGFVSDALRRGLTQEGPAWKSALNWFFREGSNSDMNCWKAGRSSDCGPSESAHSGHGWTSTMMPSAPAAIAAFDMMGTRSRRPVP